MQFPIRFVPADTKLPFMTFRFITFPVSVALMVASIALFLIAGLNLGIDFRGGTLIEIKTQGPADIGAIRGQLASLELGDVQVQEFGAVDEVLIRVEQQVGGDSVQQTVIDRVKETLGTSVEYRRVEVVGPKVSGELAEAGAIAVIVALLAVLFYIYIRFEWQFAVGAVAALVHDVILTIGIFALAGIEFNLSSIAAVLTIVGYSLNDTVVVYDRIRETLRKYKKMALTELLDLAVNQTLSRTVLTSVTTLLALFALFIFGGAVIQSFTFAMIFGVLVGTYSSVFIAAPVLIFLNLRPGAISKDDGSDDEKDAANATA